MGIDRTTTIERLNVVIDDIPKNLKGMREQADKDGQNDDGLSEIKKLSITGESHSFSTEEYYFEENKDELPTLEFNGIGTSTNGDVFISISLPLSDEILIDILQYSMKKLSRLKTAMEALK